MELVSLRRYSGEVAHHTHEHHQIVLPFHGQLEIEIERDAGQVKDSIGAFISAGRAHSFFANGKNAFVVLDVPFAMCSPELETSIPAFFEMGADIQGLLDYVTAARKEGDFPSHLHWAWSVLLLDRLTEHRVASDRLGLLMGRAVTFMHNRLADSITVADIAEAAGLSATRLHAAFRDRLSTTPHAYLTSLRINAAVRMLTGTSVPIAEVAMRTGHRDQSALTRALRHARGQTPGELRRRPKAFWQEKPKLL